MQTRHSHMLATARFLQTRSDPKIVSLPCYKQHSYQVTHSDSITCLGSLQNSKRKLSKTRSRMPRMRLRGRRPISNGAKHRGWVYRASLPSPLRLPHQSPSKHRVRTPMIVPLKFRSLILLIILPRKPPRSATRENQTRLATSWSRKRKTPSYTNTSFVPFISTPSFRSDLNGVQGSWCYGWNIGVLLLAATNANWVPKGSQSRGTRVGLGPVRSD